MNGRPPNVLVLLLDAVRAKSIGLSGGRRVARTPVLDALAREGTNFPRAVAPANWTVPSHMSMMTGTYPSTHGVRTFLRGEPPFPTVASWLKGEGYQTAVFTEQAHLVAGYGLESGYDTRFSRRMGMANEDRTFVYRLFGQKNLLYSSRLRSLVEKLPPTIVPINAINHPQEVAFKADRCGRYVLDEFRAWLGARDPQRPFHAFINIVDGHEPYPVTEEGRHLPFLAKWYSRTPRYYLLAVPGLQGHVPWAELEGGYLLSIAEADRKVGEFLRAVEQAGARERTLVIVTADHGQSFGEGGNVYHGCGATDSITRVPLVIAPPRGIPVPRTVERWVSLVEMPAWIKAAARGGVPYDEAGRGPAEFTTGAMDGRPVYCEGGPASDPNRSLRGIRRDQPWNHRQIAAYRDGEKLVLDLETGGILRWPADADPDRLAPERVGADDAVALRREVFGPYESADRARSAGTPAHAAVEVTLDERLRSWGYD